MGHEHELKKTARCSKIITLGDDGNTCIPVTGQLIQRSSLNIPIISKLYSDIKILRISLKCQWKKPLKVLVEDSSFTQTEPKVSEILKT